jgi:hypothetical protein
MFIVRLLSYNSFLYVMNNMVVLDNKQQFVLLYKEICVDYYFANQIKLFQKNIRIDMKINYYGCTIS